MSLGPNKPVAVFKENINENELNRAKDCGYQAARQGLERKPEQFLKTVKGYSDAQVQIYHQAYDNKSNKTNLEDIVRVRKQMDKTLAARKAKLDKKISDCKAKNLSIHQMKLLPKATMLTAFNTLRKKAKPDEAILKLEASKRSTFSL